MPVSQVDFLPLGADRHSAAYRALARDGTPYFVKLRRGPFDELAAELPRYLRDQGIARIMAPQPTSAGQLWTALNPFTLILYPYVEGRNGYEVDLPDRLWWDLGQVLRRLHSTLLPSALLHRMPQEHYDAQGRESVQEFLEWAAHAWHEDPIALQLAAFLEARRGQIHDLVQRAGRLAQSLAARPGEFALCHGDLHAGNLLIGASGQFWIVDWDSPMLAPKERDLMAIGGGLMGNWRTPQREEELFYQGYGLTQIDPVALAYYRYERIIQDIDVFCQRILQPGEGDQDREQCLQYLQSSFLPNGVLDLAFRLDPTVLAV